MPASPAAAFTPGVADTQHAVLLLAAFWANEIGSHYQISRVNSHKWNRWDTPTDLVGTSIKPTDSPTKTTVKTLCWTAPELISTIMRDPKPWPLTPLFAAEGCAKSTPGEMRSILPNSLKAGLQVE